MGDEHHEALQRKLEAVHQAYRDRLPGKLAALRAAWDGLSAAEDPMERLRALHREVHSLVGSSGTFGYDELSRQARLAERHLRTLLEAGRPPTARERCRGTELLDGLASLLATLGIDAAPRR